jgi:hypothetical protein
MCNLKRGGVLHSPLYSALVTLAFNSFHRALNPSRLSVFTASLIGIHWLLCAHSLLQHTLLWVLRQPWSVPLLIYLFLLECSFFDIEMIKTYLLFCGGSGHVPVNTQFNTLFCVCLHFTLLTNSTGPWNTFAILSHLFIQHPSLVYQSIQSQTVSLGLLSWWWLHYLT